MGTSKISVDLNQRSFEIEIPDERIAEVIELLGALFERLQPRQTDNSLDESVSSLSSENQPVIVKVNDEPEEKSRRKRANGKNGGAKVRSYELVDLNLSEDQRLDVQKFFAEKDPSGQNDQVATLGVKLKSLTKKSEYSVDQIHSAFKIVNMPTPKNLIAVFGNMKRDSRAGYSDNKLIINSFTEDYVNFHMKKNDKKAK